MCSAANDMMTDREMTERSAEMMPGMHNSPFSSNHIYYGVQECLICL
jgi:hypothetical protein